MTITIEVMIKVKNNRFNTPVTMGTKESYVYRSTENSKSFLDIIKLLIYDNYFYKFQNDLFYIHLSTARVHNLFVTTNECHCLFNFMVLDIPFYVDINTHN